MAMDNQKIMYAILAFAVIFVIWYFYMRTPAPDPNDTCSPVGSRVDTCKDNWLMLSHGESPKSGYVDHVYKVCGPAGTYSSNTETHFGPDHCVVSCSISDEVPCASKLKCVPAGQTSGC